MCLSHLWNNNSLITERTKAGFAAARARDRKGGHPPTMSASDIKKAAAILADLMITEADVAKHFKVSRTTLNASLQREVISA